VPGDRLHQPERLPAFGYYLWLAGDSALVVRRLVLAAIVGESDGGAYLPALGGSLWWCAAVSVAGFAAGDRGIHTLGGERPAHPASGPGPPGPTVCRRHPE